MSDAGCISPARFRVLTFVTDQEQYAAMRHSFTAAGFVEGTTSYQVVDNTAGNTADPYDLVGDVLAEMAEDVLVLCHQDIRLDLGAGYEELVAVLQEADTRPGKGWAVAGPAGIDLRYEQVLCIRDPWQIPRTPGPWPVPVQALDELMLVIRRDTVRPTPGLRGFHFYGADLCAAAHRGGWEALAVYFPVTHLSDGEGGRGSTDYRRSRDALQEALSPLYGFALLVSSTGEGIVLSRHRWLRAAADRPRVRRWLKQPAVIRTAQWMRPGGLAP